jgi:hypothetical protein
MAADVLLYNALNANRQALAQRSGLLDTELTALCSTRSNLQSQYDQLVVGAIACTSNNFNLWCLIPEGSGWTGSTTICNTSTQFNCGFCCQWTVPVGVTCARFQLWGAGAGTGGGCCCSISPWSSNGAYASVIIPVTAGNTYTICSGCAACCFAVRAVNNADGCPSFVIGTGLNNFCADGGQSNACIQILERQGPFVCGCIQAFLGHCQFNAGTDYCQDSGCYIAGGGTRGGPYNSAYNFYPSTSKTFYGTTTSGATVYGINGLYGRIRIGSSNPCVANAPIYGYPSCCCNCCLFNYNSGCCRSAQAGYMQIPGVSGWPTYACGGATTRCGDMGRMGMVRICTK